MTARGKGWVGSVHPPAQTASGEGRTSRGRPGRTSLSSHPRSEQGGHTVPPRAAAGGNSSRALTRPGASGLSEALWGLSQVQPEARGGGWGLGSLPGPATRGSLEPTRAEHKVGWEASSWRGHTGTHQDLGSRCLRLTHSLVKTFPTGGARFPLETPVNALLPLKADCSQLLPLFTVTQAQ